MTSIAGSRSCRFVGRSSYGRSAAAISAKKSGRKSFGKKRRPVSTKVLSKSVRILLPGTTDPTTTTYSDQQDPAEAERASFTAIYYFSAVSSVGTRFGRRAMPRGTASDVGGTGRAEAGGIQQLSGGKRGIRKSRRSRAVSFILFRDRNLPLCPLYLVVQLTFHLYSSSLFPLSQGVPPKTNIRLSNSELATNASPSRFMSQNSDSISCKNRKDRIFYHFEDTSLTCVYL